ncbi:hypothetical protein, partial [Streptomyces griseosporeus]|uniref:hypothetical protein n=1 Tax=Streptomyces griseosporeus TaxID=1910 RepID=UPI0036FB3601
GEGNEKLNVAKVTLIGDTAGGFGIAGLEGKVVLGDLAGEAPALASHGERLFLAWKGAGNTHLNVMFSDNNGATFKGKRVFREVSTHTPALASHPGPLLLAWAGEGNEKLNVGKVTQSLVAEVRWPNRLVSTVGEDIPRNALGEPDGKSYVVRPGSEAKFAEFNGRYYPDLFELIGAAGAVTHGDVMKREDIFRTDILAFEHNGNAPAAGGGWESCDWTFEEGARAISVSWDGRGNAARDSHVVGNGSIRGADFKEFFEATHGDTIADDEVISFLAFSIPELNLSHDQFTVTIAGTPSPGAGQEATPDVECIGLLPRGY